jgi:hypothetical protein
MKVLTTRAKYEAPKMEVQRLRELPSALASSGQGGGGRCHPSVSKGLSCSTSEKTGKH